MEDIVFQNFPYDVASQEVTFLCDIDPNRPVNVRVLVSQPCRGRRRQIDSEIQGVQEAMLRIDRLRGLLQFDSISEENESDYSESSSSGSIDLPVYDVTGELGKPSMIKVSRNAIPTESLSSSSSSLSTSHSESDTYSAVAGVSSESFNVSVVEKVKLSSRSEDVRQNVSQSGHSRDVDLSGRSGSHSRAHSASIASGRVEAGGPSAHSRSMSRESKKLEQEVKRSLYSTSSSYSSESRRSVSELPKADVQSHRRESSRRPQPSGEARASVSAPSSYHGDYYSSEESAYVPVTVADGITKTTRYELRGDISKESGELPAHDRGSREIELQVEAAESVDMPAVVVKHHEVFAVDVPSVNAIRLPQAVKAITEIDIATKKRKRKVTRVPYEVRLPVFIETAHPLGGDYLNLVTGEKGNVSLIDLENAVEECHKIFNPKELREQVMAQF